MALFSKAFLLSVLATTIAADGPAIYFHPNGCSSWKGVVTLVSPGSLSVGPGSCTYNDGAFPNGKTGGGYRIEGLRSGVGAEIKQGPSDGLVCGQELQGQYADDGCYDLPALGKRIWWDFCTTGLDCTAPINGRSYPPPSRKVHKRVPSPGILEDDDGEHLLSSAGNCIPVYYESSKGSPEVSKREPAQENLISKRQSNTFFPPDKCVLDSQSCQSLADSGSLKATCVNCKNGFGAGVAASSSIDCRNSGGPCLVTYTDTLTITSTIDASITFGATIGDAGKDGVSGHADFGFGISFSTSTSHAQAESISIPQGKKGYIQYQPAAVLGTVVTSSSRGNLCDNLGVNKICGFAPGILASSNDDDKGQYSVVITS